ncbi:MAG TPA: hypothetical protein VM328_04200, partial [Fimbriimonadaceae bacterium]|nr:hypothetical protein [Fimbriimonadaceae bacterium]
MAAALVGCLASADSARADGARVLVNELPVLTFRAGEARAKAAGVVSRLLKLPSYEPVEVRRVGGNYRIFARGKEILMVSRQEARAAGVTPSALAQVWAGNLNKALSLPPLKL